MYQDKTILAYKIKHLNELHVLYVALLALNRNKKTLVIVTFRSVLS